MFARIRNGALLAGLLLVSGVALAQPPNAASSSGHLTDTRGVAVYVLDGDGPCIAECALLWPAVPAGRVAVGGRGSAALIDSRRLPDGTTQATYAGHSLHYFAEDTASGEINGQGFREFGHVGLLLSRAGRVIGSSIAGLNGDGDNACGCHGASPNLTSRFAIAFDAGDDQFHRNAITRLLIQRASNDRRRVASLD